MLFIIEGEKFKVLLYVDQCFALLNKKSTNYFQIK